MDDAVTLPLPAGQLGASTAARQRVATPGEERVEVDQSQEGLLQLRRPRPQRIGQLAQNPLHLAGLGDVQLTQPVHRLDRRGRLDEQRGAAGRLVVYDPAHLGAPFATYRDAVALGADRHRGVGYRDALGQAGDDRLELTHQFGAGRADRASQPLQLGRRPVVQALALLIERRLQAFLQRLVRQQTRRQLRQPRKAIRLGQDGAGDGSRPAEQLQAADQLAHRPDAARHRQPVQRPP